MRRSLVSVTLVLGVLLFSQTPAEAIFGLSKCEKVKKQLNFEESIGFESWKKFDEYRDQFTSSPSFTATSITFEELSSILSKLLNTLTSDRKLYEIFDRNTSCFTANQNSANRERLLNTKKDIKSIEAALKKIGSYTPFEISQAVPEDIARFIRVTYSQFVNWETGKVKNVKK